MTLDEYKQTCTDVLNGLPLEYCEGKEVFEADEWPPNDRLMLCRLYTLYLMACDVAFEENKPFFDHWWALPVSEKLKQAVAE